MKYQNFLKLDPQTHNRRGSTASDISSTSSTVLRNNLIGTNTNNQNNLNLETTTLLNNTDNIGNRNNSNINNVNSNSNNNNLINLPNSNENNNQNQNNIFSNSFYKEKGTQTDLALNSMINKESKYILINIKYNFFKILIFKFSKNLA